MCIVFKCYKKEKRTDTAIQMPLNVVSNSVNPYKLVSSPIFKHFIFETVIFISTLF